MDTNNQFQNEDLGLLTFDPIVIVQDVLKRWLLILAVALAVGVGAYVVTDLTHQNHYATQTTFVVSTRSSSNTVYDNLASTTQLASVFSELMNSSLLRATVLEQEGLGHFSGSITASAIPETNLLTLSVVDNDPRTAFLVTRAIVENHEKLTYEVVGNITLEVLQSPEVPTYPVNPVNLSSRMKSAMMLTIALMCALLAYQSYSRDGVRSSKEARKKLECHYLGEIQHERKYKTFKSWLRHQKTGILISSPVTSFRYIETIRKIRRRVEQHMGSNKVLMVTSLLENEGKSTVAVNLALSMAKKHKRVLYLDCDLRKPAGHILLERKWTGPGVRDVVSGKAEAAESVVLDKNTGLYMLLETKNARNSTDIAGSAGMQKLVAWAREEFDYVVMDLPPMSVSMDAESVIEFADACLLVIRQNSAGAPALNKALDTLKRGKAKLLGCILNNAYSTFLSSGQGYHGYGRYGKFGRYGGYSNYSAQSETEADE